MRRTQSPGLKLFLGMLPPPNIGRGPGWIAQLAAFVPVEMLAIAAQGHCANLVKHSHEACIVGGVDAVTPSKEQSFVVHYRCLSPRTWDFRDLFQGLDLAWHRGPSGCRKPTSSASVGRNSAARSAANGPDLSRTPSLPHWRSPVCWGSPRLPIHPAGYSPAAKQRPNVECDQSAG